MTQENGQDQRPSRRELLFKYGKYPAIFLAGSAFGGGITSTLLRGGLQSQPETSTTELELERIYTSGEIISTPAGPVKIDGWKLLFDEEPFNKYAIATDLNLNFQLSEVDSGLHPSFSIGKYIGAGGSIIGETKENGKHYLWLPATPPASHKGLVYLTYEEQYFDGNHFQTKRVKNYAINPHYFTHDTGKRERPKFYSEEELELQVKEKVHNQLAIFEKFSGYFPPLYIYKSDKRGGSYSPSEERLIATSEVFKSPDFDDEGFLILFHESSHALHQGFINNITDQTPNHGIFEAYKNLVEGAASIDPNGAFRIPMRPFGLFGVPEFVENNPYFKIFDESHYVPVNNREEGAEYGHPYSNYTELFASATTIMRFYPEQFIENYIATDPNVQTKVRQTVQAIFQLLRWYRKTPGQHENDLRELFPKYDLIASMFGLHS